MKNVLLTFLFIFSFSISAQLKINEIMSNNVSAVLDNSYNYSMWVEVFNPSSSTSYNQAAYYFTDDLSNPQKWKPTSKLITPNAFSVLWFERDDRAGHASFKLSPEGGVLYLLNLSAQVIDSVVYPSQYRNTSYGRKTDGGAEWVYFEQFSAGSSNNNKTFASEQCTKPVFKLAAGFYDSSQSLSFENPSVGESIYYTINGSEPTKNSTLYSPASIIALNKTSIIRAKSFSSEKLSSDIVTSTFFIGERKISLPIVSIVTDNANLNDNMIGLYVKGSNGITGNGSDTPSNWNQDWDRPVNFELFDTAKIACLNQELDVSISGGWSRLNPQKSLKISPRKKFGDNKLAYDIFKASKPNLKYKDIQVRNSGNDFYYSMMRDGFMQSLVGKRLNLDYLAYEPAVMYMNGVYFGIQNLRETSGKDFIYSNYGLDDTDFTLLESWAIPYDASYTPLSNYITQNDITQNSVYEKVGEMMDIDNFMNYMISEIYFGNTDWPHNNVKIWKKNTDGKWRWILYDTDFGYNLYDSNLHNHNSLLYALGEKNDQIPDVWSTLLLRRLMLNDNFRNRFIDRFSIQLSSTFNYERVKQVLDSLSAKIINEIPYHKSKWGSFRDFNSDLNNMKLFGINRPISMLVYIGNRLVNTSSFQTVNINANTAGASYKMNTESIIDSDISLKYFKGRAISLEAQAVSGRVFKQWELYNTSTLTEIPMGSDWKYFDGNEIPATNWTSSSYNDASWKSGKAQFGYGEKGEATTIEYGGNASDKYLTAYFRKTILINDINSKSNFTLDGLIDDGAAFYVNGIEIGRFNLPSGTLSFSTPASTWNNGSSVHFVIPENLLKKGVNTIAVEVHQNSVTSSDLMFDLKLNCQSNDILQIIASPNFSFTLTEDVNLKAVYDISTIDPRDSSNVVLNELVASNNLIQDEFGDKDDYIELYNKGNEPVNIAGWFLTDTPVNLTLSEIPMTDPVKTTIPPKGRLILWADGDQSQGLLHLNFKLGKEGETIILSKVNGLGAIEIVDSVSFPALDANMSYSRVPDGSDNWLIQRTSFNFSNNDYSLIGLPKDNLVQIYPTLTNDAFTLKNAAGSLITIFDLTAKIVYRNKCQSDSEVIHIGNLQRGMYVVLVGNSKYKVIKL